VRKRLNAYWSDKRIDLGAFVAAVQSPLSQWQQWWAAKARFFTSAESLPERLRWTRKQLSVDTEITSRRQWGRGGAGRRADWIVYGQLHAPQRRDYDIHSVHCILQQQPTSATRVVAFHRQTYRLGELSLQQCSRIRILRFFSDFKNVTFYVFTFFLKWRFKKNVKSQKKYQVC